MAKIIPVSKGFKEDLSELVEQFYQLTEPECSSSLSMADSTAESTSIMESAIASISERGSFIQYASVWKRMKFSLVLYGFVHEKRMQEFLDEAFAILLANLDPERSPLMKQIAYVYTLYSFYYKQPLASRVQVRIVPERLVKMRSLMSLCAEQRLIDPIYCWRKMVADGAVLIVQRLPFYGPWYAQLPELIEDEEDREMKGLDRELRTQLPQLSSSHRDYAKMKSLVVGEGEEEIRTLDLVETTDPFDEYSQRASALLKKYAMDGGSSEESESGEEGES